MGALQNPMRLLLSIAFTAWAGLSGAQQAGPESAACRKALDELRAQEARIVAERQHGRAAEQLDPWRRRAARACLGGRGDPPPPTHSVTPPAISVPSTTAARLPAPSAPPPVPALPVPQRPDTVPTVTNCDPSGCWASDGSRLQRLGPHLVGPRGVCSVQGVLLHCP